MDSASPALPEGADAAADRATEHMLTARSLRWPDNALADALAEFGASHQIELTDLGVIAVRRPTATVQEITTGRTAAELLAKLRAERDGAS
jgi:hypothetical protein